MLDGALLIMLPFPPKLPIISIRNQLRTYQNDGAYDYNTLPKRQSAISVILHAFCYIHIETFIHLELVVDRTLLLDSSTVSTWTTSDVRDVLPTLVLVQEHPSGMSRWMKRTLAKMPKTIFLTSGCGALPRIPLK